MFISSMARVNKQKRLKSANASKYRNALVDGLKNRKEQQEEEHIVDDSHRPPQSVVSKSNIFFMNGSAKQLIRNRDVKNSTNSEKTIRPRTLSVSSSLPPTSKVELISTSKSLDASVHNKNILVTEELAEDLNEKLHLQTPPPHSQMTEKNTGSSFIDIIEDSGWCLDPLHRRRTPDNQPLSVSGTYHYRNIFADKSHADYDEDYEADLQYLEKNRTIVEDAVARAATASPYELELIRLRREKLRLEEVFLLKEKCDSELERTRGPEPKWYELKSPQFTEEMEKHDNILFNKKHMHELIDYRNCLHETSRQLSK